MNVQSTLKFKTFMKEPSESKSRESDFRNYITEVRQNSLEQNPDASQGYLFLSKNYTFESFCMPLTINWFKRFVDLTPQKMEEGISKVKGLYMQSAFYPTDVDVTGTSRNLNGVLEYGKNI